MLHFHAVPKPVEQHLALLSGCETLENFALGGGTSLALRFGHRLSVDLDFFTEQEFQPEILTESLDLPDATTLSLSKNSLSLVSQGVKIDLLRHAYPPISPIETLEAIRLISVPDLAAMKLNAVTNRGSKKDFYDIVELLKSHSLSQILDFFSQKYPKTDPFAVIRSLAWFEDAELEPDPVPLKQQTWNQIKDAMTAAVQSL